MGKYARQKMVLDARQALEDRKDYQSGLRQGLAWLDNKSDSWGVNEHDEPVSYWKETASEQAWSKSKNFWLYVSEYSSVQDGAELQRSEHARLEAARLSTQNFGANADEEDDGEAQKGGLSRSLSTSLSSIGGELRATVGPGGKGLLGSVTHMGGDVLSLSKHVAGNLERGSLHAVTNLAGSIGKDVNVIARLAGLSNKLGDENLATAGRADGQQIEGATLMMALKARGDRKRKVVVNKKNKEKVTDKMGREASEKLERVRRTSVEAVNVMENNLHGLDIPLDPFQENWRVRLDIRDVDLSTAGGLLLMKTLKKMHGTIELTVSKGFKARLKTLCKKKHLEPGIIQNLRINRMSAENLEAFAPVIFSRFLRIEKVDLHGVEMRRHFNLLVESLPKSGIRTLDLSYCSITQKFMRSFAEKLVLRPPDTSAASTSAAVVPVQDHRGLEEAEDSNDEVSTERSCCSLCLLNDITAPRRKWFVEDASGKPKEYPRAVCEKIEAEMMRLVVWHPPLESIKWTTSVDCDDDEHHCIALTGWSDTGIESAEEHLCQPIQLTSEEVGSAEDCDSVEEASRKTDIACDEILRCCEDAEMKLSGSQTARTLASMRTPLEQGKTVEKFRTDRWIPAACKSVPHPVERPFPRFGASQWLRTIDRSWSRAPDQSKDTDISEAGRAAKQRAQYVPRTFRFEYMEHEDASSDEDASENATLKASLERPRPVRWEMLTRRVAKPLASVREVEWRWADLRRVVGAVLWEPKATREALLADHAGHLQGRKNIMRPLILRWRHDDGAVVEQAFMNRRELAMEWPDQTKHLVCQFCGLPASPICSIAWMKQEEEASKRIGEATTWTERRNGKWRLNEHMESLTSLNIVGNPLGNSCQDMIHMLEDSPHLATLCGLTPSQTSVDWCPTVDDPRKKTLVDCMLLAADIRVARAAAKVQTVNFSSNPLFPKLKRFQEAEGCKESDTDIEVELEKMQWRYICEVLKESSNRLACGLRNFEAFDVGLHGPAVSILVEHGLRTETKLLPDPNNPGQMIVHEGLSTLHLELNPLGIDGGEAVAKLINDNEIQLKRIVVGGLIGGLKHAEIAVNDDSCQVLDLTNAFLEPGEIIILAAAINTLPNLQSLCIGEDRDPEYNPNPHTKYELNIEWDALDFTAQRYSTMLTADFVLIGEWIGKQNVKENLKRLSLRSTGLRGRRVKDTDECMGQTAGCTGMRGSKNCPCCMYKSFMMLSQGDVVEAGPPSFPDKQHLDPFCFTLDVAAKELDLNEKFLGASDCTLIATWLDNICSDYTKLLLNGNFLSGSQPHKWDKIDCDVSGIEALGAVIHKMPLLEEIDLSNNLLGSNALLAFAAPVEGGSPLSGGLSVQKGTFRVLDISNNRIDAEGWRDFLNICSHGDIPKNHMGTGVSVIAKRNPILWTVDTSRPKEGSYVAVFHMEDFKQKTYAKVAHVPDNPRGLNNSEGQHISLTKVLSDDHSDATTASEREDGKTDEAPFKIVGQDVHYTEQALVKVVGTPEEWLHIWKESCSYLARCRFSALDISDCGMASSMSQPRDVIIAFARALGEAEKQPGGCALSVLTIDNTFDPDNPNDYTLSADFRYKSIDDPWQVSFTGFEWEDIDDPTNQAATEEMVKRKRVEKCDIPGPHKLDLGQSNLGPNDAILVCTWLKLKNVRDEVRLVYLGHSDSNVTSSSIGVRGKNQLSKVLGGRYPADTFPDPEYIDKMVGLLKHKLVLDASMSRDAAVEEARIRLEHPAWPAVISLREKVQMLCDKCGLQVPAMLPAGWSHHLGPTLIDTVQIDLKGYVVTIQTDQTKIPGKLWGGEMRDMAGMGVADVVFLTGWIRTGKVRETLKRLEVYSTGAGSRDVGEFGAMQYVLGSHYVKDDPDAFNDEEVSTRGKNLGPADSGLLAAWLAKADTCRQLTSLDISDNKFLFDFTTTKDERKELHMTKFESWTDFCESLHASAIIKLRIANTRMSPTPAKKLFDAATKLVLLDISGNPDIAGVDQIDPSIDTPESHDARTEDNLRAITALRKLIHRSKALTELDLRHCDLNARSLCELATPAKAWADAALEILLLDGNPLTHDELTLVSSLALLPLSPGSPRFADENSEGTEALFEALGHDNIRLQELDLSNCELGAKSANAMADALAGSGIQKHLLTLRLSGNHLGGIAKDSLPDLSVWWKAPPPSNARLADSLQNVKPALQQTNITDLDLGYCGLGPANIKSVAEAISDPDSDIRKRLCRLNIVGNPLTGTFWEKDHEWCCICRRCQRKCTECKERVAVCGIESEQKRKYCLVCANTRNKRRAFEIEQIRQSILTNEDNDDEFRQTGLYQRLMIDKAIWEDQPVQVERCEAGWTDCQTCCQPYCSCRMQYDVDTRGVEALSKALCGKKGAESYIQELDISSCHVGAFGILAFAGSVMTKKDVAKAHPTAAKEVGFYKNEENWQNGQEDRALEGAGLKLKNWAPRILTRTNNTPGASEILATGITVSLEPDVQWSCLDGREEDDRQDDATGRLTRLTVDSTGIVGYPQRYTLDSLNETINLGAKALGPADAELLACWLSKPDVDATAEGLDLTDNPTLVGQVWAKQAPSFATADHPDDMDDFHGVLAQPDDSDGVEGFRVLCDGRRTDQPSANKRGLEKTSIHKLGLGNIGMGGSACEAFCNIVGQPTEFSDGIEELVLPRNGGVDTGIGLQGGRMIAHVIELPEGQGMDNLEYVILANDAQIPVHDANNVIQLLDFTTWALKEDNELRRLGDIHKENHQGGQFATAKERWGRIAREFPKAGQHLLNHEQWSRRGPGMLRARFELLEDMAAKSMSRSLAKLGSSRSSTLGRTRSSTLMRTKSSDSLDRSQTLSSSGATGSPTGSQNMQLVTTDGQNQSPRDDDSQSSRLIPSPRDADAASDQSPGPSPRAAHEVNDGPGLGPGEAIVLSAAISKLDRLCSFSAETTGLGLRVDRWHRKAYTLNAPGSMDYPREKKDGNDKVVPAYGDEGWEVTDRLDMPNINFGPTDLQVLTRWLLKPEVLPMLRSVNLSGNPLIGQSWRPDAHIADFIPFLELLGNSNIKELRLANVGMGFEAAMTVVQLFEKQEDVEEQFRSLELLDVSANPLGETAKKLMNESAERRLPGQIIRLLDSGDDLSHLPMDDLDVPKPKVLKRYECRRNVKVTAAFEPESANVGWLSEEQIIEALDERQLDDNLRIKFGLAAVTLGAGDDYGWVSKRNDKGLQALFHVHHEKEPEAEPEPEPEPVVDETLPVSITVRELSGKMHFVRIPPQETVWDLKEMLEGPTGMDPEQQELMVAERKGGPINLPLEDETKALAECGMAMGGEMLLVGDQSEIAVAHAQADLIRALSQIGLVQQ